MSLHALAEMMGASGRPYVILVEGILSEDDTGLIFREGDLNRHIGKVTMTPNDDYRVKAGKQEFTFVDATDVIMWIVQNL